MRVKIPTAEVVTADENGMILNGGRAVETELFSYVENPGTGMKRRPGSPFVEVASSSDAYEVYHVYEYVYTGGGEDEIPLPAGQDIPPLFNQVVFANVIGGQVDEMLELIKVDFRAIQSGGFESPKEAWDTYERQNPQLE